MRSGKTARQVASASTTRGLRTKATVGGVTAVTETWSETELAFPAASRAVRVTVWVPTARTEPGAGDWVRAVTATLSVAANPPVRSGKVVVPAGRFGAGGTVVMTGAVPSATDTGKDRRVALPAASTARSSTATVPTGTGVPAGGVWEEPVTATLSVSTAWER